MTRIFLITSLISSLFLYPLHARTIKPYNELMVKTADLEQYPKTINNYPSGVEITIGDLHGNALKLLYFLIRNDVLKMPEEDYQLFMHIYQKSPEELGHKDLAMFQVILNAAEVTTHHKIRFLGDDLCDRGMNDYYTIHLFKKLDMAGVPFDIILSNHGNFFLSALERPEQSFNYNPYGEGENESTVQSMLNLGKIIDKNLVNKQDIIDLVQHHYLKHLKFPGYTLNKEKNELTLYSHAPIDLNILTNLAQDLKTPFNDNNLKELTHSLDLINNQISQWIMSNSFTTHYVELNEAHTKANTPSPLKQVLWNRDYTILKRSNDGTKHYNINYVHGHDSMPNVFDLDNLFGKGKDLHKGPYAIYITHS